MKLSEYDIDIFKLANKAYEYQYQIDQDFFKLFENSPVEKGNLHADVHMDKQETLITMKFHIKGTVELECDRSLERFDYPLTVDERLLFQYGTEEEELTEEIVIITRNTQSINVAQFIYEFIGLAIPMKKLHPRYEKDDRPFEEGAIIYSSDHADPDAEQEPTDPRWDILKKLKN